MNIILYGSEYGTAKNYAEELAKRTNTEVKPFNKADDINSYDTIIYIGALYAGGVMGMKQTFQNLTDCENKTIVIVTVGVADPDDNAYSEKIKTGIKTQLPPAVYEKAKIIHLRGRMDYSGLRLKHKAMMKMCYKMAHGMTEDKKTAEIRAMENTYKKTVDYVDLDRLNEIMFYLP